MSLTIQTIPFRHCNWYLSTLSDFKKNGSTQRPFGVYVSGGEIYITDSSNHRVRKILRNGQIVTICGTGVKGYNGDGQLATDAQLDHPCSVVVSSSDQVYISEFKGCRIRKIDRNGIISTIAGNGDPFKIHKRGDDQLAINAALYHPSGLFVTDEDVLIADSGNHRVRKVDRFGIISTIAGCSVMGGFNEDDQLATSASLNNPTSVFQYKNEIYIADTTNQRIRKIDQNGVISTICIVHGLTPDSVFVHHDDVYFTDGLYQLFKIFPNGTTKTIAGMKKAGFNGDDMLATECKLNCPLGIFIDDNSQIYIADTFNHCVRKIDKDGMMRTIVGTVGHAGYSGDVPFDFKQYPHIGPKKKSWIKPFPQAYHDLIVKCEEQDEYEPVTKKIKYTMK